VVCYGYRVGEVPLPPLPEVKLSYHFSRIRPPEKGLSYRRPVQISLGCHVDGAANPHGDPTHAITMAYGVCKRFGMKTPFPVCRVLHRFNIFVRGWLQTKLVPLAADSDLSLDHWLDDTSYSLARKNELREKFSRVTNVRDDRYWNCKSFMKDEPSTTYKYVRGINSRTDEFKCIVGPTFKLIEKYLFKLAWFIKYVPVPDRPRVIYERLYRTGAHYVATDFTAFEAMFTRKFMFACEFELYSYMTQYLPNHRDFMWLMHNVVAGTFFCEFKDFSVKVEATRMSGEMCTSLGNGFSNLMMFFFLCEELGCSYYDGFVEGDDGLFVVTGESPTADHYLQLGAIIKMEKHEDLCAASFCGNVFDFEDLVNITNPIEAMLDFGYTREAYALAKPEKQLMLLKSKAISMVYQYNGCPILLALGLYVLRVLQGLAIDPEILNNKGLFNTWELENLFPRDLKLPEIKAVGRNTRLLMEYKYGVSISRQLEIEGYFNSCRGIQPIPISLILEFCNGDQLDYWQKYHRLVTVDQLLNQDDFSHSVIAQNRLNFHY
jgi:hypothetical protein